MTIVNAPTTTTVRSDMLADLEPRRLCDYIVDPADRGRNRLWMICWLGLGPMMRSGLGGSRFRSQALRAFGARVGAGCYIHRSFRVHFPWKLTLHDHVHIDRDVWIINPEPVSVGHSCRLARRTVICSGGHDHRSPTFTRTSKRIIIRDRCHLDEDVTVLKGVVLEADARVPRGAVVIPSTRRRGGGRA